MAVVHGCDLPEDLYYLIHRHVWARPLEGGLVRVGLTAVGAKLLGENIGAVTVSAGKIGREVRQEESVAIVESLKFVGPLQAPVGGVLLRGNERLETEPYLLADDPYGEGWIAELQATAWETDEGTLATGADGIAAYRALLEAEDISCA
jgi:glycine cleavage system H protein